MNMFQLKRRQLKRFAILACASVFYAAAAHGQSQPQVEEPFSEYSPIGLSASEIEMRVDSLLDKMTLTEKIGMLSGSGHEGLHSVDRLGISTVNFSDATVGVVDWGPATSYPAASCLTSSWDVDLAHLEGVRIGIDARAKHVGMLLGPGINILRQPQNGRSFEYIGGEDPLLASEMVVPYIRGLQSEDVIACIKHYVGNEIETQRPTINCVIGRRALEEIYLPPFRASVVNGQAWAVMTASNRVNGQYGSENGVLLNDILRKRWHFMGVVRSDAGCVYNTADNLKAGLDLEMPVTRKYTYEVIDSLLHAGDISMQLVDRRVKNVLRPLVAMGLVADNGNPFRRDVADTSGDAAVAERVAAEGTVLLKNRKNILPLNSLKVKSIVFIGPWANRVVTGGGGSSHVPPSDTPITLYDAVRAIASQKTRISVIPWSDTYEQFWGRGALFTPSGEPGVEVDYYSDGHFSGKSVRRIEDGIALDQSGSVDSLSQHTNNNPALAMMLQDAASGRKPMSCIWKAEIKPKATGLYCVVCAVNGSGEVYLNGKRIIDLWLPFWMPLKHPLKGSLATVRLQGGKTYQIRIVYRSIAHRRAELRFGWVPRNQVTFFTPRQKKEIRNASVVLACMGFSQAIQREQADRPYDLTGPQNEYLSEAARLNPRSVAVIYAGAGVGMSKWIHQVGALLWGWYPGQYGNTAIAGIIFGRIDPSGHLPDSFSRHWSDEPAYNNFPGYPGVVNHRWQAEPGFADFPSGDNAQCKFAEGIDVGYRWYDKMHIIPQYPFGYGLSYTSFKIRHLIITSTGSGKDKLVRVSVTVSNVGMRAGADVIQLYVRPLTEQATRSYQTLQGFQRVNLRPGQSKTINFLLNWRSFAYFNSRTSDWVVPAGKYAIAVGDNSRHTPEVAEVSFLHVVEVPPGMAK